MCRALAALPCVPDIALVDGNDPPKLPCKVETIVKGDARVASIAAASIVAKVVRDRLMKRLDRSFPAYGFSTNVGYRSPAHLKALSAHGPCAYHRRSFAPGEDGWRKLNRARALTKKQDLSRGRQKLQPQNETHFLRDPATRLLPYPTHDPDRSVA